MLPPGRPLGEILADGSGSGGMCFIGGDAVPPIYARSHDSVLEGYRGAICTTFAALETRLLQKRTRSPARAQQIVERVELDERGRIAVTIAVLLALDESPLAAGDVSVEVPQSEPVRLRSDTLEPISELDAADERMVDYLLLIRDPKKDLHVHRISKRALSRTEWHYDHDGRVIERRNTPLDAMAVGGASR